MDENKTLTATKQTVVQINALMEQAFVTGSVSRVLTVMRSNAPFALDPKVLRERMYDMPTLGWSCWDMSVLMVSLLAERGIEAGVSLAFGAEEKAPAQPHSLVRVTDEEGGYFYADPYFGVGVLASERPFDRWFSPTVAADWTTPRRHTYTDKIIVNHRAHNRHYGYHILPGVLSQEQLEGALWQAEEFGSLLQYVRGIGAGKIWQIIRRVTPEDSNRAEQRTQQIDGLRYAPDGLDVTEGNWYQMLKNFADETKVERQQALDALFS